MAPKICGVQNCKSSSTRKEDFGVTFHKFPKDDATHDKWQSIVRFKNTSKEMPAYVCSRHFCKEDFQKKKDLKYVLKSDAVPSIFPWNIHSDIKMDESQIKEVLTSESNEEQNISFESKGSDSENLEAIKKFIEQQENEIKESEDKQKSDNEKSMRNKEKDILENEKDITEDEKDITDYEEDITNNDSPVAKVKEISDDQFEKASIIFTETESKITEEQNKVEHKEKTSDVKSSTYKSPNDTENSSMSLSIGSKVEVKDFEEDWYSAEIIEVDYEDTEVLVRYEIEWKKHDEWINVSSPRLRPFTGVTTKLKSQTKEDELKDNEKEKTPDIKEEPIEEMKQEEFVPVPIKVEEKAKITFEVGERCLARWRDNRRFCAIVHQDLGDGQFEVIFDDGVHYKCGIARLSKMKANKDSLHIDTSFQSTGSPSPLQTPSPNTATISPLPLYHTHLFDPTRDYLGSKSERREKKRKLNIKEIFNIGQKKAKMPKVDKPKTPVERKPKPKREVAIKVPKDEVKKDIKKDVKKEIKLEVPDAVASIIGSKQDEELKSEANNTEIIKKEVATESNDAKHEEGKMDEEIQEYGEMEPIGGVVDPNDMTLDDEDIEPKSESDPVLDEEVTLEKFEKPDKEHENVIDKIKEAIIKLEDGINYIEKMDSPKVETPVIDDVQPDIVPNVHEMMTLEDIGHLPEAVDITVVDTHIDNLDMDDTPIVHENVEKPVEKVMKERTKVKKSKKIRYIHEKKVKRDVERVKNELARMKRKFEEMRREMQAKTQQLAQSREHAPADIVLQPHEWCCRWVNGQPVGKVSEIEAAPAPLVDNKPALPRRSVQVEDPRLPPGWTKHMVRRSAGSSAGKWHVVLVSPDECGNKKFYTKADMRIYLEHNMVPSLKPYEYALMDFAVHLKLSRQVGWISNTPDGVADAPDNILPAGSTCSLSPQINRKKIIKKRSLLVKDKRRALKRDYKRRPIKLKLQKGLHTYNSQIVEEPSDVVEPEFEQPLMPLEDGYVYVGSLKVQIIENLLRCPAEGCFKNFRTKTLLQMHIKHYHRELTTKMGATPKVLDLASARTNESDIPPVDKKVIKVKIQKPIKREEPKTFTPEPDLQMELPKEEVLPKIPRSQDSPKLRQALINRDKPVKRPRVLLPVRRPDPEPIPVNQSDSNDDFEGTDPIVEIPILDHALDFETAISTHTVTKPTDKKKGKKSFASFAKNISEDEEMFAMTSDELDTRSSFPRSGTPDSKIMDGKIAQITENIEEHNDSMYTYTETGERVKIVHMKREEIINCHCGLREEDGLMVQCELCLCWQHALCHNIQRECDVPEKYTCSICLNPRRGRRSRRFIHDQDRMYEGALPGAKPKESLRRTHELAGNLLRIQDALHAMRVKTYVATKKGHPKLYLWAKEWEQAEINYVQEKLNSDYSDMHVMINGIGKENLPLRADDDVMATPPSDDIDHERISREQLGPQSLLSGLLSSPGGASLDLGINTTEFDTIANSVQEAPEWQRTMPSAPQPEAAIENDACRDRLLRHIQRCHALIDTRLDCIEAQVAELESQDPSFGEHYETADFYPQTKQTVQMLMRDLDTLEELGVIT